MPFSLFNTSKGVRRRGASTSPGNTHSPQTGEPVEPTRLDIAECLRGVIDPEVGINIVDLGLLYDLQVEEGQATVRLTMTTPACPMSSYIRQQVGTALQRVPGLRRIITELVWDPPWSPQMMDPEVSMRRFGVRSRAR